MPTRNCGNVRSSARVAMPFAAVDQRDLVRILSLAQRLDEIDRRAPLPARARLEEPLKIAVHQVRRLEPRNFDVGELRQLLPEARPQTLRLDHDARDVADFVDDSAS